MTEGFGFNHQAFACLPRCEALESDINPMCLPPAMPNNRYRGIGGIYDSVPLTPSLSPSDGGRVPGGRVRGTLSCILPASQYASSPFLRARRCLPVWAVLAGLIGLNLNGAMPPADAPPARFNPMVEIEEDVYVYEPADNGAGPMWCHGSTCLVRVGDRVFASGLETLKDVKPLNNCRWTLFQRSDRGWSQVRADDSGRTREPSPLAAFPDGRLLLSANPTLVTDPEVYAGPARPEILLFSTQEPTRAPERILPQWSGSPPFTEHSYRSLAADGSRGEFILFQNVGYTHAEWTFRDQDDRWFNGQLLWPDGADYPKPKPIRICYPNVMLLNRAVFFCGVSDIMEPYPEWRAFKRQLTGREWDYDFRRLFFTWTPDVTTSPFRPWIEIASRDETAGRIMPGDLWVGPDRRVHIVWTEQAIDERLRETFFPEAAQSHAIHYAIVQDDTVVARHTIAIAEEGGSREIPSAPRFHVTPDNRLFVIHYVRGVNSQGQRVSENRLLEILPDGRISAAERIQFQRPFTSFFTATVRAGSPASRMLELLGQREGNPRTISYARVQIR
jgi:hypothetical protein